MTLYIVTPDLTTLHMLHVQCKSMSLIRLTYETMLFYAHKGFGLIKTSFACPSARGMRPVPYPSPASREADGHVIHNIMFGAFLVPKGTRSPYKQDDVVYCNPRLHNPSYASCPMQIDVPHTTTLWNDAFYDHKGFGFIKTSFACPRARGMRPACL